MNRLQALHDAVGSLERGLLGRSAADEALLGAVHPDYRVSARNFVRYVALRQTDLRQLQLDLAREGLSSLGRLESHALDMITKVRERLDDALRIGPRTPDTDTTPTWEQAEHLLHAHTHALLGPRPFHRHVYVMVTAPSATEADAAWMERALAAGMNVLRVNAAHEDERAWTQIVATARSVAERRTAHLRIAVDLPGPKLRTVMLHEGPRVVKWKPERDDFGVVLSPYSITVRPRSSGVPTGTTTLAVPDDLWADIAVGDAFSFRDARGKRRLLTVTRRGHDDAVCEGRETAYVVPDTRFQLRRARVVLGKAVPVDTPPRPFRMTVAVGDRFWLVKRGAEPPPDTGAVGCTLDAALASLRVGHRVLFDDGHLETVAEEIAPDHAVVRVTYAPGGSFRLGGEKGINLPDTLLELPLFAADDEQALTFAARHADIVSASFVRSPEDVRELHRRLADLRAERVGVILKIETTAAFAQLPAIILAALERPPVGVMIARGDLAIESGYERLAELQEEILWLCEAAHVPVIWATQVLDLLARTGRPSRAEVTDAAMSVRAECVMLNKGPYVAEAVGALDDILRRMEQHTYKKRSLYRRLHLELPTVRNGAP